MQSGISKSDKKRQYTIKTYHIDTTGNTFPLYHTFRAQGGNIIGLSNTALGVDIFVQQTDRFENEYVTYTFLLVVGDTPFTLVPKEGGYSYIGAVQKNVGYVHVFGTQGGDIYP